MYIPAEYAVIVGILAWVVGVLMGAWVVMGPVEAVGRDGPRPYRDDDSA